MNKFCRLIAIFNIMMQQFPAMKFDFNESLLVTLPQTNTNFMENTTFFEQTGPVFISNLLNLPNSISTLLNNESPVMVNFNTITINRQRYNL